MSNSSSGKTAAERNEEYLQRLEHKNRLKKNLSIKKPSEQKAENRERGFSTHFAGANASETKGTRIKAAAVINAPKSSSNPFKFIRQEAQSHEGKRKGWANTPQKSKPTLLTPSVSPVTVDTVTTTAQEDTSVNGVEATGRRSFVEEDEDDDYGDDFECEDVCDTLDEESTNENDGKLLVFAPSYHPTEEMKVKMDNATCDGDGGDVERDSFVQDSMELSQRGSGGGSNSRKLLTAMDAVMFSQRDNVHSTSDETIKLKDNNDVVAVPKDNQISTTVREEEDEDISFLASRLKALDPAKQGQLLALLQQMEGSRCQGGEEGLSDDKHLLSSHKAPLEHMSDAVIPIPLKRSEVARSDKPDEDAQYTTSEQLNIDKRSCNLAIRIKMYNSWQKCKYASLSAVRLCVRDSNVEIPLSKFSVRVTLGNDAQPKTAEVSRNVSHLFAKRRAVQRQEWRFPIVQNSCVQLELTGTLEDVLPEDLELVVWNGRGDSKLSSPVMDMDIYFDSKCIWTGSLRKTPDNYEKSTPQISKPLSSFNNIRTLVDNHGECRSPSLIATPVIAKSDRVIELIDTREATISTQIAATRPQKSRCDILPAGDDSSVVPALSFTNMSTASSTGDFAASTTELMRDVDEPSWFSDLKTPRSDVESITARDEYLKSTTLTPLQEIQKRGGERGDRNTPARSSRRASKDASVTTTSVMSRRRNMDEQNSEDDVNYAQRQSSEKDCALNQTTVTVGEAAPRMRGSRRRRVHTKEEERKEEASLRQSLEALKKSDLSNRARIESELRSSSSIEKGRLASDLRHFDVVDGVLSDEIEKQTLLKQRSIRIDEVQEKVSSALQDLATTMSKINHFGMHNGKDSDGLTAPGNDEGLKYHFQGHETPASRIQFGDDNNNFSESSWESSMCEIPVVPSGTIFKFEILSNWGDPYYVGLCGLDLFDKEGKVLTLGNGVTSISAVPCDINELPEYNNDPRTVANLLDETNYTRDDLHVWLAPHGATMTPPLALVASITIVFPTVTSLSLVRIWNYNKSRTHCYRGVRLTRMKLDESVIFEGEVRMAPGLITCADDCSEVVLFSTSSSVLERISSYDVEMGYRVNSDDSATAWVEALKEKHTNFRPRTSDGVDGREEHGTGTLRRKKAASKEPQSPRIEDIVHSYSNRPFTAVREDAVNTADKQTALHGETVEVSDDRKNGEHQGFTPRTQVSPVVQMPLSKLVGLTQRTVQEGDSVKVSSSLFSQGDTKTATKTASGVNISSGKQQLQECDLVSCRVLTLSLDSTWGDKCYIGLCGVEVTLGCSSIVAELGPDAIDASPRDLSSIGVFDDPRVPENLVDGNNNTTDDRHMWLIPFTSGSKHELRIDMGSTCKLSGINVWNYNKSNEDSLRGVRLVTILGDGKLVGRQEFRIAPGCDGIVYKQQICFRDVMRNNGQQRQGSLRYTAPTLRQDYEPPYNLSGMLWKFDIYSNWGDGYYVGLDGVEFVGHDGNVIDILNLANIVSSPHMWDLEVGVNDPRVPRNLGFDRANRASWLTPLSQSITRDEQLTSVRRLGHGPSCSKYSETISTVTEHEAYFYDHNVLFVLFEQPVNVAVIRFFNYSKSPNRGVKNFGIEVDHKVVYMGRLQRQDSSLAASPANEGQSVVFSCDPSVIKREKNKVSYCGASEDQDVLCINDRKVIVRSKDMYEAPSVSSEGIYSDLAKRPATAVSPHM